MTAPVAPKVAITKLEAARRQLRVAISLWFQDGDEVAIHTLACAAHQIIHDINQHRGGRDLLFDSLNFKGEYRKEAVDWLKKDMNFFKHAEKDPEGVTEFSPMMTELFIMMSLMGLELFGLKHDSTEAAFVIWYGLKNPQILTEKAVVSSWRASRLNRRRCSPTCHLGSSSNNTSYAESDSPTSARSRHPLRLSGQSWR